MSSGSLIPDRQLTFSPDLAATIGLEEAILLQGIGHQLPTTPGRWHALVISALEKQFPFWQADHIRALLNKLADLGIIAVLADRDTNTLRVAIATGQDRRPEQKQATPQESWQPSGPVLDLLALNHGIDRQFALAQLASFERGTADHTRESRFRQHVLGAWRRQQSTHQAFEVHEAPAFGNQWQPSPDAMDIMGQAGVDPEFVDAIRPEFILYWRERGGPPKEVNSKFIAFVRQRWTRYSAGLSHSTEPTRMTRDWHPHEHVFDILELAGIGRDWAGQKLPEFILYWCDSNELHTSWNSKFLQHVKHQWRWEQRQEQGHGGQQGSGATSTGGRTRDRSIADDLSDTSWAE